MTHVADKLREARALVEKGWCKGSFETIDGSEICFCADGALGAVAKPGQYGFLTAALARAIGGSCPSDIWKWNDSRTSKDEVLAGFDKAIELASGTEAGTGETEGLDPKGDGPTAESGDARNIAQNIGGPSQ